MLPARPAFCMLAVCARLYIITFLPKKISEFLSLINTEKIDIEIKEKLFITKLHDENEEYFLGSIVTFKNEKGKSEVIDGQQRLTTLMLILRAFYDKFANMQDKNSILTRDRIEKCIWKTDTFGTADKNTLKIDSEVATDNDKEEFLELLRTGIVKQGSKSQYVLNYQFIQKSINRFDASINEYAVFFLVNFIIRSSIPNNNIIAAIFLRKISLTAS